MSSQIALPATPALNLPLTAALIAATVTGRISRAFRRHYTRVKTWWGALSRARDYSKNRAKHKFRRGEKTVTHHDRVRIYTTPLNSRRPKFVVRETGMFAPRLWDSTDVQMRPVPAERPPVDELWVRRIRAEFNNAALLMTGAEGPLHHVDDHRPAPISHDAASPPDMDRYPDPDGEDDRRAEPLPALEGRSDHHGHTGQDRRRGVQRPATWLCPRDTAVHDLVSEDDYYWAIA